MAKKKIRKRITAKTKPHGSGKFAKGNTAGSKTKGKQPSHKKKIEFAEIFKAAVSNEDIKNIAAAMIKEAEKGNVKAAQLILDRCCGKPAQALEVGGLDGAPIAIQIVNYAGATT